MLTDLTYNKFYRRLGFVCFFTLLFALNIYLWGNYYRQNVGFSPEQPIEFSHKAHIEKYDMKCTFCHYQAEKKSIAAVPSTFDCMVCHSALKENSEKIQSLMHSLEENVPIKWNRVYKLPEYTHFSHSTHLRVMIDCSSCHGEVEKTDQVKLAQPLTMKWCLDCHRDPLKFIVPARRISGIYTAEFDYFEEHKYQLDTQISSINGDLKYYQPIIPRLPKRGPENCTACHY